MKHLGIYVAMMIAGAVTCTIPYLAYSLYTYYDRTWMLTAALGAIVGWLCAKLIVRVFKAYEDENQAL